MSKILLVCDDNISEMSDSFYFYCIGSCYGNFSLLNLDFFFKMMQYAVLANISTSILEYGWLVWDQVILSLKEI
jgi:hypothetical protein